MATKPIKTRMSETQLTKSLARARRQQAYRYDRVRFYRHRSKRPQAERDALTRKWLRLAQQADEVIARRRGQLAYVNARQAARTAAHVTPRQKAVRHAQAYAGRVREQPAGSNRGGLITTWQLRLGAWLVGQPWCGTFCGNVLLHAGVKGISPRIAAVAFIEDDARARRGCYRGWTHDPGSVLPGDLVVLFGRGVHVELVVRVDRARGVVHTVGGNTSAGAGGSQANGGGVYARVRPLSAVHGFALVDYP